MLLSSNHLSGSSLSARDGSIGRAADFLFDDRSWSVRYVVVETRRWLGRDVLLSPAVVRAVDGANRTLDVDLAREQVKSSPDIATDLPVSRQHEVALSEHYQWPAYWMLPGAPVPVPPAPQSVEVPDSVLEGDPGLRSCKEVVGYAVAARDGDIGSVEDFILDIANWSVRFLVVDTGSWLPGRKVLVTPASIDRIVWDERKAYVALTRAEVEASPDYEPSKAVNRILEHRLYDFRGRPAAR